MADCLTVSVDFCSVPPPVPVHVDRRTPSLGCVLRPEVVRPSSVLDKTTSLDF